MNENKIVRMSIFSTLALALVMSSTILPSEARWGGFGGGYVRRNFAQNHPRRAEVLGRDRNLQRNINQDRGALGGHYGQLSRENAAIHQQEQRDARMNGGFITAGQQNQLNREENSLNRQISRDNMGAGTGGGWFQQHHPRRSQVLGRDNGLNSQLGADRGQLGGHYGQLQREDNSIARQEQRDASMNGGWISTGQQNQLNHEENRLQNQINRDYTGGAPAGSQ